MIISILKKYRLLRILPCGLLIVAGLVACVSAPIKTDSDILDQNPNSIVMSTSDAGGDVPSGNVIWGGVIVSAYNLNDRTQLEILSYPLSEAQRPRLNKKPTGRFLIQSEGYLELASYQQGRLITVLGTLQDVTQGTVGSADYQYPTITSNELHLWRVDDSPKTGIVFGIGISIGG